MSGTVSGADSGTVRVSLVTVACPLFGFACFLLVHPTAVRTDLVFVCSEHAGRSCTLNRVDVLALLPSNGGWLRIVWRLVLENCCFRTQEKLAP